MSETVQVISKLDPATDSPFLGDTRLMLGEHVVEFKGGRAMVLREVAALLRGHRHVDVFGLDDVAPPVAGSESTNAAATSGGDQTRTDSGQGAAPAKTLAELVAEASDEEKAALLAALSPTQPPAAPAPLTEPWDGYNGLNAKDAVSALAGKTPEQVAAVKAYESSEQGKKRGTVIKACGVLVPREAGDGSPIAEGDLPEGATIGPDGAITLPEGTELTDEQKQRIADAQAYLAEEAGSGND